MSEHNYTSLRDLLKDQQPPPKIGHAEKDSSAEVEIPLVTEFFGELYFRESSSSSTTSSLDFLQFSPPLPLPLPKAKVSSNQSGKMNQNLNDGPKTGDFSEDKKKLTTAHDDKKKNLAKNDSCMYNNSSKLFPPPISTLKMAKTGEPFTYQRFDEKTNAFVDETIMLPPKGGVGVMAASRENGRLRMNFADGGQEEDENDEGEATKIPSDGEESDEGN